MRPAVDAPLGHAGHHPVALADELVDLDGERCEGRSPLPLS
ncbi:hypothetical protein ACFYZB_24195 [Streptomyces sp. NPDC001852]